MSTPSSKSTFPGVPKSGSANEMFIRCFHLQLKGIGCDGRIDVILGSTNNSSSRVFYSLPKLVILKSTMPRDGDFVVAPLIPVIFMPWWQHGRWRCCAKCSVMNLAVDAESNNALALVVWPSGLLTLTWHVISRTSRELLHWDVCVVMTPGLFLHVDTTSGTFASLSCVLTCSQEWWGFCNFLHFCTEKHLFLKWPGLR